MIKNKNTIFVYTHKYKTRYQDKFMDQNDNRISILRLLIDDSLNFNEKYNNSDIHVENGLNKIRKVFDFISINLYFAKIHDNFKKTLIYTISEWNKSINIHENKIAEEYFYLLELLN